MNPNDIESWNMKKIINYASITIQKAHKKAIIEEFYRKQAEAQRAQHK